MALYQFWRKLLDENGRPVTGAKVNIYLARTTIKANIYDGNNVSKTNPITTASDGIVLFYIRNYEETNGYAGTQKFKIVWSGTDQDGISVSGTLDNVQIFPNLFQVDETDNTSSDKGDFNKLISNDLAYSFEEHIVDTYSDNAHDFYPVDENDPKDATPNKLINNYLMKELYSLLASAQAPTIEASGAVAITLDIGTSGSAELYKWVPSAGYLYVNLTHGLQIEHPIIHVFDTSTGEPFFPYKVESIDLNTTRVWSTLNIDAAATAIG